VTVGADIPARLRDLIDRMLTTALSGRDATSALSSTELEPFVEFAIAQSGGVSLGSRVRVTVGRSGVTGGGGELSVTRGEWSFDIFAESGSGGTTAGGRITYRPGARSGEFTCPRTRQRKGRFERTTSYECTHTSPPRQPTPEPEPALPDAQTVSMYYEYKQDVIREAATSGELARLRDLLGRGYRVSAIEGFTSPEGPMERRTERFEGNVALSQERADVARTRALAECGVAGIGRDSCFVGGPSAVTPLGRNELHTLTRRSGTRITEVEGSRLATHVASEFMADETETARLNPADRTALAAARSDAARAAIIYPYLRRAVLTLTFVPPPPAPDAPRSPTRPGLPADYFDCPADVLDRAKPLFDRPLGPRR
jgi:hypothetical protein